jgi:NodT family efflux transporter outer membrane factor (OMF) lipoprotein
VSRCKTDTATRAKAAARALTTLVIAVGSTVLLALAGCASSSGIAPSATLVDPAKAGVSTAPAAPLAADWWQGFGDPALTSLIDQAVAGSPSLRVVEARVARAAANAGTARAADGPQLGLAFDATRQRYTENGIYPPPLAGSTRDSGTLQLNGSWELDLFGRNRAALDAAIGAQRAAEADAAAARIVLAVYVARNYVQLARLIEQREVLQRSLTQRDQVLGLIRQRVSAGLDTTAELYLGEGALPETRQQIEAVDEQIALTRHALAAFAALPPDAADALAPRLTAVRAVPVPELVPADLLGRRADIVAARWRVEAATGDVAAAKAQFYPNINLVAFVGLSTLGLDRLLQAGSVQYGVGPAIRLPIFDSGRLRANLSGRTADLDAAIASYNGSVVDAVHDVADQISSTRSLERQLREQTDAVASAERAYDVATQRYRAGLATYLTVLSAETNVLTQRRLGVDIRARTLDTQMLLVRALGGGYVAPAAVS